MGIERLSVSCSHFGLDNMDRQAIPTVYIMVADVSHTLMLEAGAKGLY